MGADHAQARAADVAQIVAQARRFGIEGGEPEAEIVLGAGLVQAQAGAVEIVAVVGLLPGHADQLAVQGVVPAVIAADERFGPALLGPAERIAPVAAGVEEDMDLALLVASADDLVLADVVDHVVARLGDLAVMANEVPASGEDALHLQPVERLVGEDAPVQGSGGRVEQGQDPGPVPRLLGLRAVGHARVLLVGSSAASDGEP